MKDKYRVFNLITLAGAKDINKPKNISFNYIATWDKVISEPIKKENTNQIKK